MIYTVTFNPALDYVMQADVFVQGSFNRANGETFYAGGKGINVSWVLRELQQDTVALGFVGGFTGEELGISAHAVCLLTKKAKIKML